MREWQLKPLREVCEINPRFPRNHDLTDGRLVSFVPMASVDEVVGRITGVQARSFAEVKKGYTSFRDGDVLFAKITPCMENGKAAVADNLIGGHGFGSTEFHVLRPGLQVTKEWLFYFVRRPDFRRRAKQSFTGTAGQQRVPATFMASATIPVPPLPEQHRIVDLLARAESIVQLRRDAERKAAELIPALFLDMFGDPATNPKGWPLRLLRELVTFMSGGTPSKARRDFWEGDLPWVSPKDMKQVSIADATDHVNRKILTETSIKLVPAGSLLIVVRGMILVHTVPIAGSLAPLTINQDMKALLPLPDIDSNYLLWLLRVSQPQLLNLVATAAHGTKKLETGRLKQFSIPLPPLKTQQQFTEQITQIEFIQTQQSTATAKAQATFDSLLARNFAIPQQ